MKIANLIILLLLLSFSGQLKAVQSLEVQALMQGMVVLKVDGQRVTLKTGQQKNNVKLISSNTKEAVLEVNGKRDTYRMGTAISTTFTMKDVITEQIIKNDAGMFLTHGSINGHSVRFLIDTGASSVAMSAYEARKLGIPYRQEGTPVRTHTASGVSTGWKIKLKSVRLGELEEQNVEGIVIDGGHPVHVLLGMSFLDRMKVEKEGNKMKISSKR